MNRITAFTVAAATLLASTAPALAGEAPRTTRVSQPAARIVVTQCDRDALTEAAFRSDYGSRPVFVTAEQVISAQATGERWAAPRCMTASEHRRLTERLGIRVAL